MFNDLKSISAEERAKVKELTERMAKALDPQAIYLFGSVAENREKPDSDYDFYIVMGDTVREDNIDIMCRAHQSLWGYKNRPCDILTDKSSYFEQAKNRLNTVEYDVFHKGVKVYAK